MVELADIIAPIAAPPAPPPYGWIALGAALLVLILFFGLWFWLKRTRAQRRARGTLKRIERDLRIGQLDARGVVFQIAAALQCAALPISPRFTGNTDAPPSGEQTSPPLKKGEQGGFGSPSDPAKSPLPPLFQRGARLRSTAALDAEWAEFTQALTHARFSPHPIDTQHAAQLLAQARHWIARAPC